MIVRSYVPNPTQYRLYIIQWKFLFFHGGYEKSRGISVYNAVPMGHKIKLWQKLVFLKNPQE